MLTCQPASPFHFLVLRRVGLQTNCQRRLARRLQDQGVPLASLMPMRCGLIQQ